ncbi:RBBP9/YdeN family alpha/beta hydrolase [Microbacterium sp. NPDC056234]|uniref:RBBP9/YdeN family alpha/beta hydrolase n=1 Tax=Microbacterium sp. NPDC056234 TaxID=3345757 RepID=UPI0035DC7842
MTSARSQAPATTNPRAVIFHGYGATPADHWFSWLAEQLEAENISATIPALPYPREPDPDQWEDDVRAVVGDPDKHTIVIAHSLGCLSVLRYLRSLRGSWRLGTLALVSGFVDPLPVLPELDSFIGDGCDLTGLRDHIDRLVIVRSDNDSIVPPAHTDRLAEQLGTVAQVLPGAGHFLAGEGVIELPLVRDAIMS